MSIVNEGPLAALAKLMRRWPGEPLDSAAPLRRLNPGGTRPPLFWIFNAAHEPAQLAAALGPDQPLIVGRSLHLVMPPGAERQAAALVLGRHYAAALSPLVGRAPFWIGANCLGRFPAVEAAVILQLTGARLAGLCLVNGLPASPLGVPGLLIFGGEDQGQDPFVADPQAAEAQARASFTRHRRLVLPGVAHGGYFDPGTVDRLAAHLLAFREDITARPHAASAVAIS